MKHSLSWGRRALFVALLFASSAPAMAQVATWDEVEGCWKRLGQCVEQPDK